MRFEEIDGEEFEEPGAGVAAVRALKRAGTMEWSDELEGALESAFPRLQLGPGDFFDPRVATPQAPSYRQARDNARAADAATREAHPTVSGAVELGTALLHPINKVGGRGLSGAMVGGAVQGGIQGLGDSRAELTDGDIMEYVQAFGDTAKGAGLGALFGAGGHGAGKVVRAVGTRTGRALDNAREALFREEAEAGLREAAERDAQEIARMEAKRAAEAKAAERMAREHGQGLEMNKAVDRRAAKETERVAMRAARPPRGEAQLVADPESTGVLRGYQGSAGERRAVNYDRVQAYRERLADPELPGAERERIQRYVESYGDAVDNPGAFERAHMERELRKRYPQDVVDRIMAERVGPDGQVRSRGLAAEPAALPQETRTRGARPSAMATEPKTLPAEMVDWQKNGWAERGPRVGGGGSAWEGGRPPRLGSSEPPTQVGLIRTSPDGGMPVDEGARALHTFEFTPGDGRAYNVEVLTHMDDPGTITLGVVHPEGGEMLGDLGHGQTANTLGPGMMKQLLRELARSFPEAERLVAERSTGATPGRRLQMRLPEVTRVGAPEFPPSIPSSEAPTNLLYPRRLEPVTEAGAPAYPSEGVLSDMEHARRVQQVEEMADRLQSELRPVAEPPAPTGTPTRVSRPPQVSSGPPTRAARPPRPLVLEDQTPVVPVKDVRRIEGKAAAPLPPYLEQPQPLRSPAMERVGAREADAFGELALKGGRAVMEADNPLSAAMRGPWAVTREAIRNPAVRARALSVLRLRRLEQVDPATFARVGRSLEQALQQGSDEYAATVHVYNQTDPAFREAERQASEGVEGLSDEQLEAELRAAGLL